MFCYPIGVDSDDWFWNYKYVVKWFSERYVYTYVFLKVAVQLYICIESLLKLCIELWTKSPIYIGLLNYNLHN